MFHLQNDLTFTAGPKIACCRTWRRREVHSSLSASRSPETETCDGHDDSCCRRFQRRDRWRMLPAAPVLLILVATNIIFMSIRQVGTCEFDGEAARPSADRLVYGSRCIASTLQLVFVGSLLLVIGNTATARFLGSVARDMAGNQWKKKWTWARILCRRRCPTALCAPRCAAGRLIPPGGAEHAPITWLAEALCGPAGGGCACPVAPHVYMLSSVEFERMAADEGFTSALWRVRVPTTVK